MKLNLLFIMSLLVSLSVISTAASGSDSIYFKNFVYHSNNTYCPHIPPQTAFTVFLNNNEDKILIENAPRFDLLSDPNITGNGTFGVELALFINPQLQVGDKVYASFTCNATGEQGTIVDSVDALPWVRFPLTNTLIPVNLPLPPQNLTLNRTNNDRILNWNAEPGIVYDIYRKSFQDSIPDGRPRNLYERIAVNIFGNTFTDITGSPDQKYGYIIYAINQQGIKSSHSEEVNELMGTITGVTITPYATNTIIKWNSYNNPQQTIVGYNIYRRQEGMTFGNPFYNELDTTFIDSRLNTGETYIYKIKARYDSETEIASSAEESVMTLTSTSGFYSYANLKIAVVIYKNTNGGTISDTEIFQMKNALELGKLFYWRNSYFKLNVEYFYYIIDDYVAFNPEDFWGSMMLTANHLAERGVMNTQHDIIFRITRGVNGYWSYGVQYLPLPGPIRQTGFSHVQWPVGTDVKYPGFSPDIKYGLIWLFVHEVQHAIDDLYRVNGQPQMYHGDIPWEFPVACGEHYDFQAKMFKTFDTYEQLLENWGNIYEAVDADNDELPDNESLLVLNEEIFNSRTDKADTDDDGLSDREEAFNGTFSGSNPNNIDSDGDGLIDGEDDYPRYPMKNVVPNFAPLMDGVIDNNWVVFNDTVVYTNYEYSPKLYLSYTSDSLYLGMYLSNVGLPQISFDFQSDGWWWGNGNTMMEINISNGTFTYFRSWDASEEVRVYSGGGGMWDDDPAYQSHFNRRVINPLSVNLKVNLVFPVIQVEIAIPKTEFAGLNLNTADQIGLNVYYSKVNNQPSEYATTFDQYSFAYFYLGSTTAVEDEEIFVVKDFNLLQNFPNPFNPLTKIAYQIPEVSNVKIKVYDLLGREIKTLVDEYETIGKYSVYWDGKDNQNIDVSSGVYFYRLESSDKIITRKMMLLR
ncbi:MAG: hypothetical protein A2V93_07965 [Ignavibacteria bacterium RBG_16_34_14]|nr:MAG: hypothetical protein A2V93_07965 [Ignavibacteria bacterium RBG_16_34_14]